MARGGGIIPGPARRALGQLALLLAVCLAMTATACTPSPVRTIGRVEVKQGRARLIRDRSSIDVRTSHALAPGDIIDIPSQGAAELRMSGGRVFELKGARVGIASERRLTITRGSLLSRTEEPVSVDAGPIRISSESSTFRIDEASGNSRLGAYEASGLVMSKGDRRLPVPRYWQATFPRGNGPPDARPISFSTEDPWDRELLADAIQIDSELGNLLRGLQTQLAAISSAAVLERLEDTGVKSESAANLSAVQTADLLTALVLAESWKESAPPDFSTRLSHVLVLRSVGASWGLIAQQLGVDRESFFTALRAAIDKLPFNVIGPGTAPARRSAPAVRARGVRPTPAAPQAPATTPTGATPPPPPPRVVAPLGPELRAILPDEIELIVDELYGILDTVLPILP
jgi:hypothetical protein